MVYHLNSALVQLGTSILVILGLLHCFYTFVDLYAERTKHFTGTIPELEVLMKKSPMKLSARSNSDVSIWTVWMGFNLSHARTCQFWNNCFILRKTRTTFRIS